MRQAKLDAEANAASERESREYAKELVQGKKSLLATVQVIEHSLACVQEGLLQVQTQVLKSTKDNTEIRLHDSERRIEELTTLVQKWRERAEDTEIMKEAIRRTLQRSREAQYNAQRQVEEYRQPKAKAKAKAGERSAERYSEIIKIQAKKNTDAASAAILAKKEADSNARTALQEFDKAQEKQRRSVRPMTSPSEKQIDALRRVRQFRDGAFHIGVADLTGAGKSSLINALMGVLNGTPKAAPTGIQSTKIVGRYVDVKRDYAHIWYDIPGAGTLTAPSSNYFYDQGLYVFDALIIAWDTYFSNVDTAMLQNCVGRKIPAFIVRTKSDTHISEIEDRMREAIETDPTLTDEDRETEHSIIPFSARAEYISETRQNIELCLRNANLPSLQVYLVSNETIMKITQNMQVVRVIDELHLLNDIRALKEAMVGLRRKQASLITRRPDLQPEHQFSKNSWALPSGALSLLLQIQRRREGKMSGWEDDEEGERVEGKEGGRKGGRVEERVGGQGGEVDKERASIDVFYSAQSAWSTMG
ncbi:hypothetical protein GYMLUDRAFT_38574 [Collybiopsis luxurians FD-317 M1]|nr:hypothetical protein GYMLUDRAFT_38574 [Collybiopsis luxurians FD-317 M1]